MIDENYNIVENDNEGKDSCAGHCRLGLTKDTDKKVCRDCLKAQKVIDGLFDTAVRLIEEYDDPTLLIKLLSGKAEADAIRRRNSEE